MNDDAIDHGGSHALGAFVLGALAGAALGLLFAPARGSDSRARLSATAREGRDRAARLIDENRETLQQQKARVETLIDRTRTHVGEIKADVAGAVKDARNAFEQAKRSATGH